MHVPDCSEGSVEIECGGFANVSQSMYQGRRVALKVVRVYITSDLEVILSVSIAYLHCHTRSNEWIAEILSRGRRLETPLASQHLAAPWSDSERTPVRSGFRMDGKWKYQ